MKIHIALKIARQYEGEYVFIQAIKACIDRVTLSNFLSNYQYDVAEEINGIGCVVEVGVIEANVDDFQEFYGQIHLDPTSQIVQHPMEKFVWKNLRKLPVAQIENGQFPTLLNPEVLDWAEMGEGKREGKGLVWVEQDNPFITLDPETFVPTKYWGELRLGQAFNKGRYGPLVGLPPEEGDLRGKEEV